MISAMAPLTPTWICLSPAYDAPLSIPAALCFAGKSWSFKSEHQICTVWVVNYVFLMTFNSHFCCLAVSLLLSKSRFRKLCLSLGFCLSRAHFHLFISASCICLFIRMISSDISPTIITQSHSYLHFI